MSAPPSNARLYLNRAAAIPGALVLIILVAFGIYSYASGPDESVLERREATIQAVIDDPNLGLLDYSQKDYDENSRQYLEDWSSALRSMYGDEASYYVDADGDYSIQMAAYPNAPIVEPTFTCLNAAWESKIGKHGGSLKACLEQKETATYGMWASRPCTTLAYAKKYGYADAIFGTYGLMQCLVETTADARAIVLQGLETEFDELVTAKATALNKQLASTTFATDRAKLESIALSACSRDDRAAYQAAERVFNDTINDGTYESLLRDANDASQKESAFDDIVTYVCSQE